GDARPTAIARAEELPFRPATFDTVLGMSVITYLPEPARLIEEAWRVLKPGGAMLLDFPQMLPPREPLRSYFRFSAGGAGLLLERSGFEVIEMIPVGGLWTHVGMSLIVPLNRWNEGRKRVLTELPVRALYGAIQLSCAALEGVFGDAGDPLGHLAVARRTD